MADPAVRPAVTAIIVVRDGEAYLAEAIDSVLAQTLDDWQLLVVDDGSTDATPDIVRSYVEKNGRRVRLLAHPNGANLGIAASRNLGVASAQGRYIAFLDSDDVWLPEKLAEQVAILDADPQLGLVYGRTLIWSSWAGPDAAADFYYPLGIAADRRHDPPVLFELLLRNEAQTPTTCNAMIRADVFGAVGGFDPRFRGMFEDVTFFAKALASTPAYVSGRTWAKYRQHPSSCSARSAADGRDAGAHFAVLTALNRSLSPLGPSRRVRAAVRRARFKAAVRLARSFRRRLLHQL